MRARELVVALAAATAIFTSGVQAKPLSKDEGPAEMPPAGYTGTQYVDSRGCVYIRAGFGGDVDWVPRVNRAREVMCGFKPTQAAASAPVETVAAKPAAVVKPAPQPVAQPVRKVAPQPVAKPAQPAPMQLVVNDPVPTTVFVPKGYVFAWKDDRLNPHRAKGTAQGEAQMDQVWTRDVPARLVKVKRAQVTRAKATPAAVSVRVSTRAQPQPPAAKGGRYVQVGMFGVAANAQGTIARLRAMGLPVAVRQGRAGGKPAQIVMAGPFSDAGQLNSALAAVRKAGFRDAFTR